MSERDSICASEENPEAWKPVVGYESTYEVSSRGRIRCCGGRMVGQWTNSNGYCLARFSSPRKVIRVHRVVAEAFISNPQGRPFVNHIDCLTHNNCVENLEWCTQLENLQHSDRLGRMQRDYWIGKRPPSALMNDDQVREIRALYSAGGWSWESLGKRFGISKRAAGRIVRMETYRDVC